MPINFDLSKYKTKCFIETGTFKGDGCRKAIAAGFTDIKTIEINEDILNETKSRLKLEYPTASINYYLGDSVDKLSEVMLSTTCRSTIWLDAHLDKRAGSLLSNNNTIPCPLLHELDIISKHTIDSHTIIIDDMRVIRKGPWNKHVPRGWGMKNITVEKIINKIKGINNRYKITYEDGFIPKDCLVAYI